jgi:hypothetical protein
MRQNVYTNSRFRSSWDSGIFLESIFIDQATLNGTRPNSPAGVKPALGLREPGGDLIALTVRVAGATVVNGVIGHCRPSQIIKLWQYN